MRELLLKIGDLVMIEGETPCNDKIKKGKVYRIERRSRAFEMVSLLGVKEDHWTIGETGDCLCKDTCEERRKVRCPFDIRIITEREEKALYLL